LSLKEEFENKSMKEQLIENYSLLNYFNCESKPVQLCDMIRDDFIRYGNLLLGLGARSGLKDRVGYRILAGKRKSGRPDKNEAQKMPRRRPDLKTAILFVTVKNRK